MKFLVKFSAFALISAGACAAQTSLSACSGMALGTNGAMNGFVPSGTDAWHTDITNAPVDPGSANILTNPNDLAGAFLHPDFGSIYGIPYNVVDSSQTASVSVGINLYAADSDITLAPVPANAVIEGSPAACPNDTNDRHMIVIDRNKCVAYEYFEAGNCNGSYSAGNTALWDLTTTEQRPYGLTSADAAGLSVFEGLIRYDEIVAGQINHAIRFTASHTKNNANGGYFVAPATHAAGNNWGTDNIIGMRLRLKPGFDISSFSPTNQIILKAMKQYGMILADNGSSMYFQGTTDSRWDDNDLSALKAIPSSAFDVLQMATPYDASTAPTGAAPTINSFTASSTTVTAGTPVTLSADVTNASYNYVDNAGFVRSNTVVVSPTQTTTYTLSSRNSFGTSTKAVTVTVVASLPASTTPTSTTPTSTTPTSTTPTSTTPTSGTSTSGTSTSGTSTSGTSTSGTSTPTSTTPTTTVKTNLRLKASKVSPGVYTITATSNSPAPVTLTLMRGAGSLSGNTLTVFRTGYVMVSAEQPAISGYTYADAIVSVNANSLQ